MSSVREDIYYNSNGAGQIHACLWSGDFQPKSIVQIVHGIAEHVYRYDEFANYLNEQGFVVVAEDHMGHGASTAADNVRGYFRGGWFVAIEDTMKLMDIAKERFGDLPYILFGHSMGSFMARTILAKYPDTGLAGCVICGTGWQSEGLLSAGIPLCNTICRISGEKKPSKFLKQMVFGGYNQRVEHKRTDCDWLSRDEKVVDAYIADPLCGFTASAGLMRDMMLGIRYVQQKENLSRMNKKLPCLFVAGGDDPVGPYGNGVRKAAKAFEEAGMEQIKTKIYPLCRHEILNEINRAEVYEDIASWMASLL